MIVNVIMINTYFYSIINMGSNFFKLTLQKSKESLENKLNIYLYSVFIIIRLPMIEYKKMYIMCLCLNYRWSFIKNNICYYMKRIRIYLCSY